MPLVPCRRYATPIAAFLCTLAFVALAVPADAQWVPDGIATGLSTGGAIHTDLAGGIVTSAGGRLDANGYFVWTTGTFASLSSCPDARGGVIVAGGGSDLYAQRLTVAGTKPWGVAPNFYAPVSLAAGTQSLQVLASDGAAGAFLAWLDTRSGGTSDVYAAHVDSTGVQTWAANGVPVSTADNAQVEVAITADGSGGAFVFWRDKRTGVNGGSDMYGQHLDSGGNALWGVNGVPISNAAGDQQQPITVSDGSGGAFVTWWDQRSGDVDVYVQHVDAAGTPLLGANGQLLAGGPFDQLLPAMIADGAHGVWLTWEDHRLGTPLGSDIYLHHLGPDGASLTGEVAVCTESHFQTRPGIATDGAGGVVVAWQDGRTITGATTYYTPYAQHLSAAAAPLWSANGMPVNGLLSTGVVSNPVSICADGTGGAYFYVSGNRVYRLVADGSFAWLPNFAPAATGADVPGDEGGYVRVSFPAPMSDTAPLTPAPTLYEVWRQVAGAATSGRVAGTLATVTGSRAPSSVLRGTTLPAGTWEAVGAVGANALASYALAVPTRTDSTVSGAADETYVVMALSARTIAAVGDPFTAHSVDNLAPPAPVFLTGGRTGESSVRLAWQPVPVADVWHYTVYRGDADGFTLDAAHRIAVPTGTTYTDDAFAPGDYYAITATDRHGNEGGAIRLAPAEITSAGPGMVPAVSYVAVAGENPFAHRATIEYGVAGAGRVSLALYDLGGRRVATLVDGERAAGVARVTWDGAGVHAGVYLARFAAPGVTRTLRLVRVE